MTAEIHICPICNKTQTKAFNVKRHLKNVHNGMYSLQNERVNFDVFFLFFPKLNFRE